MSLLMTSQPIVINRDLACRIGLNEAIVLQQLHYWLNETNSGTEHGGIRWVYNTTEQWLAQFPFWSESTLKRTFASLKSLGVLRREQLNKSKRDMTNFYTINYESELLEEVKVNESIRSKCTSTSGQSDLMDGRKMTRSIGSKRHAVIGSKWPNDLTENTTEITTENKTSSRPDASQPDTQTAEQEFLTRHPDAVVFSLKKRQWGTQDDLTCAQWLWKKIIALYEQAAECDGEVVRPKEPNWTAWANEIRLMCVQDGRTHKQICEMYSRVSRDPFWCRNVLSPSKLREKWDELSLRLSPSVSTYTEKREDPYFKASYDNVDYSQIPVGFRG
ncbi:hypothetical protein [Escherichia coli]|uniref:hypothetical protein n=1 Tax=Escherichia coli TaxID=562 RepID=UPI000BE5B7BE|nr:hypothetical protein [Escherichia coli]